MGHIWSILALAGVILLALMLNSYLGISKIFAPAPVAA
jgi:hypothetical protein